VLLQVERGRVEIQLVHTQKQTHEAV
jgi:hypothetical protein